MKKILFLALFAFAISIFSGSADVSALSTPATGQFSYFYKPPRDGTSAASIASLNRYVILTRGDETYRTTLRSAGYTGTILQYLGGAEVHGPGPYLNSSASCDRNFQAWRNQVAYEKGDFCRYLHPYESYFLHNSRGERLYEDLGGGEIAYHMNPAASGWRSFFIQRAKRELVGDATHAPLGYNGLFLDNVWISLWTLTNKMVANSGGTYPLEYSTDSAYRTQMAGLLSQLKTTLNGTGKYFPVLANFASDAQSATSWDSYLPYVDGGMNEAFAADWSSGYLSASEWNAELQKAERVMVQGKTFLAVTQGWESDTARMRFTYASFLLVMQPNKGYYRYAKASTGYEYQWDYSDYWTDIGAPAGARYQQSDGSWRRNFTRGYVVVDPSTRSARIVQGGSSPPPPTPPPAPPGPPGGAPLLFLPLVNR